MNTTHLAPKALMPAHDLTATALMPAHDPTATAVMTTRDPTPAATLAGNTTMGAALADFGRRYPAYAGTAVLDGMRARDYTRLDATGHVYLDYTGGGLYAESQLARHRELLADGIGLVTTRISTGADRCRGRDGWRDAGRVDWPA